MELGRWGGGKSREPGWDPAIPAHPAQWVPRPWGAARVPRGPLGSQRPRHADEDGAAGSSLPLDPYVPPPPLPFSPNNTPLPRLHPVGAARSPSPPTVGAAGGWVVAGRGGGGGTHTHTFGGDPRPGQGSTVVPTGGWERAAGGSAVPAQPSPGKSLLAAPPRPLATEPRGSRPLRFPQRPAVSRVPPPPPPSPSFPARSPFPWG